MKREMSFLTFCMALLHSNASSILAHDSLTPILSMWNTRYEVVPQELLADGMIELDSLICLNKRRSAVYGVKDQPAIVIKYEAFCSDMNFEQNEGILNEAKYLQILQPDDVANFFIMHSEGFDLSPEMHNSAAGKISDLGPCDRETSRLEVPRLRYIVTERISHTVSKRMRRSPDGKLPFEESIRIGIRLLTLLEKVHARNVIHGDIHEGNIGYRNGDSPEDLILIDFGRANTLPDSDEYPVFSYAQIRGTTLTRGMVCNGMLSPWMSMLHPANFRDDIYRAVQLMATVMFGMDHIADQDELCDSWSGISKFLRFKLDENIFDVAMNGTQYRIKDVVGGTPYESRAKEITYRLGLILHMVRTAASKPAIGPILEQLRLIIRKE